MQNDQSHELLMAYASARAEQIKADRAAFEANEKANACQAAVTEAKRAHENEIKRMIVYRSSMPSRANGREKVEIKNSYTGEIQFTAEIECDATAPQSVKIGLAIKWAMENDANLECANLFGAYVRGFGLSGAKMRGAILCGADMRDADFSDACLRGTVLSGANMSGAIFRGADFRNAIMRDAILRSADLRDADIYHSDIMGADMSEALFSETDLRLFKSDFWMTLTENPNEVGGLMAAINSGLISGSQYNGKCACLIGTIANLRRVSVEEIPQNARNPAEAWFSMIRVGDRPGDASGGGFAASKAIEWAHQWIAIQYQ